MSKIMVIGVSVALSVVAVALAKKTELGKKHL